VSGVFGCGGVWVCGCGGCGWGVFVSLWVCGCVGVCGVGVGGECVCGGGVWGVCVCGGGVGVWVGVCVCVCV